MSKNHMGETEYNSYSSWKRAAKQANSSVWFDGDADIGQAMVGTKPYKKGETTAIGEWDGVIGVMYKQEVKESKLSSYIKEDDETVKLSVGDQFDSKGTTLTVKKILSHTAERPIEFDNGMSCSYKTFKSMNLTPMNKIKESKSSFVNYFKSLNEKKYIPPTYKIGQEVIANGKKGTVTKFDEDYVTVQHDGSVARYDHSKVKTNIKESQSPREALLKLSAMKLRSMINNAVAEFGIDSSWKAPKTNDVEELVKHLDDLCNEKRITVNDDLKIVKSLKESQLNEFINMKRVTIGHSKIGSMNNTGEIVILRNEDEAIDQIITMMGLDRTGKPKKIGECFVVYDDSHKNICFYEKETDIPKEAK